MTIFFMADSFQIFNGMNLQLQGKSVTLIGTKCIISFFFYRENATLLLSCPIKGFALLILQNWLVLQMADSNLCVFWWTFEIYFWYLGIPICLTGFLILSLLMLIWMTDSNLGEKCLLLRHDNEAKMADKWGYQVIWVHQSICTRYSNLCSKVKFLFLSYFISCGNGILQGESDINKITKLT